ncbi:Kinase superfamily protein [Hibiscus syriacus]|uniref:Kinase superfamily protein n=1 Tax=Hibiscus syriacus TaxID=106335 RepID=A0A6A2WTA6_HIBSY|nr:Kinase superfamily protein [Hibiscus syriacus]
MAKEFLKTHDQIFASRPQLAVGKYVNYNYSDMLWAPYGPHWRQSRKIYLSELFSSKRLESFQSIRVEEMRAFVSRLHGLSGKPVVLKNHLVCLTLSTISRMVFGKKHFSVSGDDQLGSNSIMSLPEFKRILFGLKGYIKRMKALKKKLDRFHDHVFDQHKRKKKELAKNFVPQDMVDLLLQLADDPDLDVKLTYDHLRGLTLVSIFCSFFLFLKLCLFLIDGSHGLITGPDNRRHKYLGINRRMGDLRTDQTTTTHRKSDQELDRVIGRERWVDEKDIPQLPYLDAIMKETMRKHPIAPLLVPHLAMEDCKVAGYDIRKGTRVYVNTWSIGRDPSLWEQPEEFRPERFLGRDIDVKGRSFELLPFGAGRRMCPAYNLGLKMVQLSIANLLQAFNWKLPDNTKVEDLSMEESSGLTTPRKFPLVAVMEPRLPLHLYKN